VRGGEGRGEGRERRKQLEEEVVKVRGQEGRGEGGKQLEEEVVKVRGEGRGGERRGRKASRRKW